MLALSWFRIIYLRVFISYRLVGYAMFGTIFDLHQGRILGLLGPRPPGVTKEAPKKGKGKKREKKKGKKGKKEERKEGHINAKRSA